MLATVAFERMFTWCQWGRAAAAQQRVPVMDGLGVHAASVPTTAAQHVELVRFIGRRHTCVGYVRSSVLAAGAVVARRRASERSVRVSLVVLAATAWRLHPGAQIVTRQREGAVCRVVVRATLGVVVCATHPCRVWCVCHGGRARFDGLGAAASYRFRAPKSVRRSTRVWRSKIGSQHY